jgi:hypothetical protein
MLVALAPLLVPVAIWIYTLVFAFSSLWFAHFTLAALLRLRAQAAVEVVDAAPLPAQELPLVTNTSPGATQLPPPSTPY